MSASLYEISLTSSSFAAWQQQFFGAAASDPSIAGPLADPDADGLPNLLEYVTANLPKSPGTPALLLPTLVTQPDNSHLLRLQFPRRKNLTDALLLLQTSSTLDPNSWNDLDPATLNPTIDNIDAETERWTILLPISSGSPRYYRLRAQQQ